MFLKHKNIILNIVVIYFWSEFDLESGYMFSMKSSLGAKRSDFVWNEALNVMSFHRNKMNEYLCKNYVANEILSRFRNESLQEKLGGDGLLKNTTKVSRLAREALLADPGSQKYKDWLSRSSTLEDIYRQLDHADHESLSHQEGGTTHDGEVTGYALVGHNYHHHKPIEYGADFHHGYHKEEKDEEEYEGHDKGLKLKELFHFALTAIAFLAFACFMIEIILCLMETPQTTAPDYVLVPTSTGTGHASKLETEPLDTQRQERSLNLDPLTVEVLNAMSSRVLASIEALTILHEDDGQCLQRALCQSTKYSNKLKGIHKIWLPFWSFGMSWIGDRLSRKASKQEYNTLKYLKAAVLGLGKRECHVLYPKCNQKRRRKRDAVKHLR